MNFLMELILIIGVGILILHPEDLPVFMRFLGRCVVKVRAWRKMFDSHVDNVVRDLEVEDFKNQSYRAYEDNVKKALEKMRRY